MLQCARFSTALVLSALFIHAQSFDVATIRANHLGPDAPNGFFPSPGRLRVANMTLEQMIHAAFHIKTGALFGAAAWMQSDRFDIEAKTPGSSTFDQSLTMLQGLLTERFRLRYHRETRQLKVDVLVLAKGGPKFPTSADQDAREQVTIRPTEISGTGIPFGHFVSILEAQLKYPVTNETGLKGKFDLSLKYVREDSADGPSVFAALEDQLGLKLESRRAAVDVFVIDSAAKPTEN
ncbi:MAG TPA: TIGR03435 family protein [Candidatus Solibacter sp.]|nr:TIGR03435 family protein [Candidatus Solibacter sp.]